jgi:hypothetical protein
VPDFARDFDKAFDRLDPPDKKGRRSNYVTLHALREALPRYDRKTFDAELNKLRRAQRYSLDASDGRHARMTRAEQAAGIEEAGELLVYVAQVRAPIENPSSPIKASTAGAFYSDGLKDHFVAQDLDLDLVALARKVLAGEDRYAVVRAAVDVYLREAEEAGAKEGWIEQNAELIEEVWRDENTEGEALYREWLRGWRDGTIEAVSAELPIDELIERDD